MNDLRSFRDTLHFLPCYNTDPDTAYLPRLYLLDENQEIVVLFILKKTL